MKMLFIAPLPPPITGHSMAAKVLLDHLATSHDMVTVDLSVGSANDGSLSWRRIREVGKVLGAVWRGRRGADAIYLTISESVFGNLKDLCIYALCALQLSRFYIHLHGGSIGKLLFDRHPLLRRLNALAIRRMGGVIISGPSHGHIFDSMIARDRIHIVPNFAHGELFVDEGVVVTKFSHADPLRVLYISGMTAGKGYRDLADAYLGMDEAERRRFKIDFAGRFDSAEEQREFENRIRGVEGLEYHGVVDRERKRSLFARAHAFCLPTTFLEGQPISVLEAYASGCVVVVTGQPGVRDVFTEGVNGFEIEQRSPASIANVLRRVHALGAGLAPIARANRAQAEREFRTEVFGMRLARLLEGEASPEAP